MRRYLIFVLALLAPVFLHATTVIPPSFDELVGEAEVIFEGRLSEIESKWVGKDDARRIQTFYTFQVTETLKGNVPATYTLHMLGGTVGDETLEVLGAPNFAMGERVLLFVTGNGTQFVPLVGIMHGHFSFKREEAQRQDVVVKHDGAQLRSVEDIGKVDPFAVGGRLGILRALGAEGMTPTTFKNQIRTKLSEITR